MSSSKIIHNNSTLTWQPLCPSAELSPSAKLCWNTSAHMAGCVVLPNTTLQVFGQVGKPTAQFGFNALYFNAEENNHVAVGQ